MRGALKIAAAALAAILVLAAFRWDRALPSWLAPSAPADQVVVSGNIEAHESILGFKTVQSRIVALPFDEGQWVKAGTLIARVDDADYRQQAVMAEATLDAQRCGLAAARESRAAAQKTVISDEADLAQKKLDFERSQSLWTHHITSTEARDQAGTALKQSAAALDRDRALALVAERNVDLAQANIHSAEEALKLARIVLGYTVVNAPFDGVILVRQAELGEIAAPGTPIVTLADLDHVWLRAYINEPDIGKVRYGEAVTVTTDSYPGKKYHGRISFISSSAEFTPKSVETHAERVTLVYRIRIDIDNPTHELVPGLPADAEIPVRPPGVS